MSAEDLGLVIVKVKQEKIDAEVEARMRALSAFKVKSEPEDSSNSGSSTPPRDSPDQDEDEKQEDDSKSNDSCSTNEDKKCIQPLKSSNEILAELFKVFNAKPPAELLDDKSLIKKSLKRKKHKKEKKKHHKKAKLEVTDDDRSTDNKDNGREHKKKKRHKHKDKEKDKSKHKDKEKSKGKSKEWDKNKDRSKSKETPKENNTEKIHIKTERKKTSPTNDDSSYNKREVTCKKNYKEGIVIKIKAQTIDDLRHKQRSTAYYKYEYGDRDRANEKKEDKYYSSETSLSDEETFLRERERAPANKRGRYDENEAEQKRRYNSFYGKPDTRHSGRSRGNDVHPRKDYNEQRRRTLTRSASHSRSRSRDLGIDKKKLLEIARKNAITMFKRGNLPGCADMSEEIKDKVLLKMRYGGRTVQDLTDFCKKISNGEHLSDLSSDEDSDVDKGGNVKAFHHPFLIKEREPIVMNIRNAVTLPVRKTDDQTKAITMQFPVSSGQQHRVTETWVPVEKKDTLAPLPMLPVATQSTNIFKGNVAKNVFQKPMPPEVQQEPAFKALTPLGFVQEQPTASENYATSENYGPVTDISLPPPTQPFVPDVPVPSASTPSESIFSQSTNQNFDVSSIITKRLNAMRRLQENPLDPEALKMMFNSQKEMSSWVSSKHMPGQFTGSTGANVLKVHELNNGPQIWARRDQLIATQPVSGGMGMHLLQKMGWKPGEGLGPQKSGSLQPLLLDVKLDKRGLVSSEDHDHKQANLFPKKQKGAPPSLAQAQQDISGKHPVCLLNELTSKRKWTPPLYTVVNELGPSHSKMFLFSVQINGQTYTPHRGSNTKKEAKMLAAKHCLQQIGVLPS